MPFWPKCLYTKHSFFLKSYLTIFTYVCGHFVYYVFCNTCTPGAQKGLKRTLDHPGLSERWLWATYGFWELNLCFLEKQSVLSIAAPPLQTPSSFVLHCNNHLSICLKCVPWKASQVPRSRLKSLWSAPLSIIQCSQNTLKSTMTCFMCHLAKPWHQWFHRAPVEVLP